MLSRVERFIRSNSLLPAGSRVLVGVSGGADSVALLRALCLLREKLSIGLEAAHINHGIRPESADEERFVAALCAELGVPLHVGRADVPALARVRKLSLETAAREARHGFFRRVMAERGIDRLALAHHRDDQAETVLLRLLRGSGADGLGAMAPREASGIVRPLLCAGREDIRAWCRENGFAWVEDASNADVSVPRNWVRHELMPLLRNRLNPQAEQALCRAAELLREDAACLNALASDALAGLRELPGGGVRVPVPALEALPRAVLGRALRQALARAGLGADVERVNVGDIMGLLGEGRTGRRVDLDGGAAALREADGLVIVPRLPALPAWEAVELAIPGETAACGGVFTCEPLSAVPEDYKNHPEGVQYFDMDAFPAGAVARGREDGDRFHPLGAPGGRKLKEYLVDRKAGRWGRDFLPLVAHGRDVLWVVGHGIADGVKITETTRNALKITYRAKESGL